MAASRDALLTVLFVVRLAFPVALLVTALSLLTAKPRVASTSPSPITSVIVSVTTPRRSLILSILSLIALTYFLDGFALVLHSILSKTWQGTPAHDWWRAQWSGLDVEAVVGLLATGLLAVLGVWKETKGVTSWTLRQPKIWALLALSGTIIEVALLASTVDFINKPPVAIPELPPIAQPKIPTLLHCFFPLFRLLLLIPLLATIAYPRVSYVSASEVRRTESGLLLPQEDTSLLTPTEENGLTSHGLNVGDANGNSAYGTFRQTVRSLEPTTGTNTRSQTPTPSEGRDATASMKAPSTKLKAPKGELSKYETPSWAELYRRLRRITPYLWPKKSAWLQFLALLCILVLIVGRFVMVALPLTLGALLDVFETQYWTNPPPPQPRSFWPFLLAYVGLRFLQGSGGLAALRDTLWAPVMQYSDREMSQMTFNHLLSLSFAFHMKRKTGEILRILDRGSAINRVFELLLFNIAPTIIDIIIALVVFVLNFGWELAVVVGFVVIGYITASITLTAWRATIRRQMNDKDIITRGIHTDCLLNYETVKYFGGEAHESERYANAIRDYQVLEYRVIVSLNLLNLVQNFMITLGFLVGGMIVALRVTRRECTTSDFVVFVTYLAQLYGPLNQLGYIYRSINTSLVDTERLMKLLEEPTEVNDKPDAPDLIVNDGEIEFDNVSFSYDGRTTALNGVSFKVPKGSSVALVGESGSGKSTILRLLYRFYDLGPGEGRILIDSQDIRDVTQGSLRKAIGVVPQDSVLFNASIEYNIGYGKLGASHEEIEAAAKAAQMHDRIMTFPEGYETKVGERGVRLSGGEKQRVAIARTLLKNPPILLLDEATSALDTSTEKDIQKALQNLVKGRSSLSIAHRLSTIASADVILVLKDGQIVEQGSHSELLEKNGIFATMWADQISAEEPSASQRQSVKQEVSGYSVEPSAPEISSIKETAEANEVRAPQSETVEVVAPSAQEEHESPPGTEAIPAEPGAAAGKPDVEPATALDKEKPLEVGAVGSTGGPAAAEPEPEAEASTHDAISPEVATQIPSVASPDPTAEASTDAPVAFPTEASVSFPASRDSTELPFSASPPQNTTPGGTPGVTFDENVQFPARSGTPDPASEPKRKRTASQNFQRFARRVSLVAKRSGSTSSIPIPSPSKKDDQPRSSNDGSVRGEGSPAASIQGDDGKKSRKDKLMKRLSMK